MKNMKWMIAAVLMLCLALSLCACGGDNTETTTEAPTEEVTEAPTTETPTEETEETLPEGMKIYTVTIVDEEGNPIPKAMVQLCKDTCFPGVANEEGVATFQVPEDTYKVSFLSLPAGYTYTTEEQEFYFEAGSADMIITLKAEA